MNLNIRKIGWEQLETIYDTYMKADFGGHGLKPLEMIRILWDRGCYEAICLYEEEELRAYALFVLGEGEECLLLDYLAVCREARDRGFGGIFLSMMKEHYADKAGILLETESMNSAPDQEQYEIRSRRLRFYLRNGCCVTKVKSLLFDGEYDILYIPIREQNLQVQHELENIYDLMFPEPVREKYVSVWKRQNWLADVRSWQEGKLHEKKSLLAALGFGARLPRIISLVGGGGKTTTMYQLADELAELGKRVLVTTTTHIGEPKSGQLVLVNHASELKEELWKGRILTAGTPVMDKLQEHVIRKLSMPEGLDRPEELARLLEFVDVILIEADGAKCKPIKIPQDWEPVLLPQTGLVIACVGLSAIGQTFEEACFRFEKRGGWLARAASDPIAPEDAALILMDERGSRKQLDGRYYKIILNQADDAERRAAAEKIIFFLPVTMKADCVVCAYGQMRKSVLI